MQSGEQVRQVVTLPWAGPDERRQLRWDAEAVKIEPLQRELIRLAEVIRVDHPENENVALRICSGAVTTFRVNASSSITHSFAGVLAGQSA